MSEDDMIDPALNTQRLLQLLSDPIRSRIYFETLIEEEITAQQLMKQLSIHRSTLTHHLTKFVEAGIFKVRIQETGRPIKYYSLKHTNEKVLISKKKDPKDKNKILMTRVHFLESIASHLQVISNLASENITKIRQKIEQKQYSAEFDKEVKDQHYNFYFHLLTEEQAALWNKKYFEKMQELDEELNQIKKNTPKGKPRQIIFSGSIPIKRKKEY